MQTVYLLVVTDMVDIMNKKQLPIRDSQTK